MVPPLTCGVKYFAPSWKYPFSEYAHYMYLNLQFLETLDKVVIPRDYPEVSSKSIDRTTQGSLSFVDMCPLSTFTQCRDGLEPDKESVKCEVGRAHS